MIRNESTTGSISASGHSAVAVALDPDFEARWAAWRRRGVAHDRAVRRRVVLVAGVVGIVATAVAIAYMLLRP